MPWPGWPGWPWWWGGGALWRVLGSGYVLLLEHHDKYVNSSLLPDLRVELLVDRRRERLLALLAGVTPPFRFDLGGLERLRVRAESRARARVPPCRGQSSASVAASCA